MSDPLLQSVPQKAQEQLAADRLVGIDVLRGLAVLAVVMNHIPHYAHGGFRENPWFFPALMMDLGYLGVPLFVLISGFCIHRRAAIRKMATGEMSLNWIEFWKRRFWRLYPPYVAAIVFSLGCTFLLSIDANEFGNSLVPDLTTHLLLIHNLTADYAAGLGNGAFWSLGMEEQLYLLYIPLLLMLRGKSQFAALMTAAATTIVWRLTITAPGIATFESWGGAGSWGLWPFSYWLHWALGAFAVHAYFGNCRLPKWCSSPGVAITFGCIGLFTNRSTLELVAKTQLVAHLDLEAWSIHLSQLSSLGELASAIAFFCVLNWCVQNRKHVMLCNPVAQGIAGIGKISYSIYLIHVPVLLLLEKYIPFTHSATDWILRLVFYLSVCLLTGVMFFLSVERWFLSGRCPRPWHRRNASVRLSAQNVSQSQSLH